MKEGGVMSPEMSSSNYTSSLSLRVGRSHSSPNRTITNGSILNGNINRLYHQEVNGNNIMVNGSNGVNGSSGVNGMNGVNGTNVDDKFEVPLPFGYHLDLDFLRFCAEEKNEESLAKLKELRKTRRKQRKTLEALMGLKADPRVPETKVAEVSRAARPTELEIRRPRPDIVPSELVRDALRESMVSFQETLDQCKSPDSSHNISDFDLIHGVTSTPRDKKSERFSTFPRYIDENDKLSRHLSNTSISSVSTSSSALPYDNPLSPEMYLASLPSSVPRGHNKNEEDLEETHSIASINSEMSTNTLRNVREQMARSLVKLKEYEAQVEAIPMLQVKLSVLKEEKRLLILKLKAREVKLRRDRGEEEMVEDYRLYDEAMETDDEDLDMRVAKMSDSLRRKYQVPNLNRRARSESPYAKCSTVHPEDFLSHQRKRSTSCGFNSDSSDVSPTAAAADGRRYYSKDSAEFAEKRRRGGREPVAPPEMTDQEVNTDPVREPSPPPKPIVRDRSINTDPAPRSPPPPRKVNHGTNTLKVRSIPKGTGTDLRMAEMVSNLEMEQKIQEAMLKTEEEILSCPLLQKALKKVEQEALTGPLPDKPMTDQSSQVGAENLRPFVIDVGLQCQLGVEYQPPDMIDSWCQITPKPVERADVCCGMTGVERLNLMRTIGVGDCKVIEDAVGPTRYRSVGVCTERWVELITSSKQTDTEDFPFKDTESPRVADMVFEPIERPEPRQRPSHLSMASMRKSISPSLSRKSSANSTGGGGGGSRKSSSLSIAQYVNQKTKATMTDAPPPTKDVKVGERCETKSVATSAMILPLAGGSGVKPALPPGSPILSPDAAAPPVNLNLCDKCDKDIHKVAQGIMSGPSIAPPSPDLPWLSKIPRPIEDAEAKKLKAASSTSNLSLMNRSLTNLQRSSSNLDKGYLLQRSKSNLEPSAAARKIAAPPVVSGSSTPPASRRNMGTPPPHPDRVPPGSKRAPSPLARSATPTEKKSLIPKFSPSLSRKTPDPAAGGGKKSSAPASPSAENRSFIPRVVTPPALRRMFPVKDDKLSLPDRDVVRKKTINKSLTGMSNPELECVEKKPFNRQMTRSIDEVLLEDSGEETETLDEPSAMKKVSSSASSTYSATDPLPGSALFAPIKERKKAEPSKEMLGALKVLNDSLARGHTAARSNAQMSNAVNIIQQEWFKLSSTKTSSPNATEDYLDVIEDMSKELLDRVVNLVDVNGNTALHYSVSHGNFDVVSVLLDSKVANPNILNKAGYTCSMLISLAVIRNETHGSVVRRLFNMADVNLRASQHGQTALMLAVSHGRLDMVRLLQEAGADINIRDEDGSTALMCAAEHGHIEIVKLLLQHPDINLAATDNDGLTALSVAMEAGHRDIGVLLYANMSFSRGTSPHSSLRVKKTPSRNSTATPNSVCGRTTSSPVPPTPPVRSRRNSSN